ncbi:DUF3710 domain-containing protein [Nocardioides yefusunii]|uniref:DUF3710 domain-containing protein n=1 Tax=Nocardioides yefusunii TaxID=2500546 RepID=A0ABW1QX44_9ACTN|nr:DUF3710 domain-containing protein [Nocardioides yefusunii]
MKFRRKATQETAAQTAGAAAASEQSAPTTGPFDVSEIRDDIERIDVGALLVAPVEGLELRLQVNEQTEEVGAAMLAGPEGAMELQAYAAPTSGGLWDEVRPQIAADVARRGGASEEREGDFGTELLCRVPAQLADGSEGFQPSRIIAVERGRWMLRATLLGRPAMDSEAAQVWEHALRLVAVRRGVGAMPVGKQIPLVLPAEARRD